MDAAAELGSNPVSKHQIQPEYEQDWQPCPVDLHSCYMCDHALPTTFSEMRKQIEYGKGDL